ncbi:hypothetical protein P3102_07650 [Amycolatopsis sp. QT-25]|uniref:hypothetical protein n=1 Tax=Amycolatopsis sp. QT-25 TaxID=3034022 RepID=UPI0023ED2297|nr:hypothetical protein [Amycolatopsis sp. QT-25]WET81090.1 hypothetical protein P3102_07650 [Amycolatopsis sp. QT-25]
MGRRRRTYGLSGGINLVAQYISSRHSSAQLARSDRHQTAGGAKAISTSVSVNSDRIEGNVHVHQFGRRTFVAEITAVVVLAAVLTYLSRDGRIADQNSIGDVATPSSSNNAASTELLPSLASAAAPTTHPQPAALAVVASWPLSRGCDGGTAVAMINGGPAIKTFPMNSGNEREKMIDAGAGVWEKGFLYLDLTAPPQKTMRILNLRPLIDKTSLPPPSWIYSPGGGCGGPVSRVFELGLDTPSLKDTGVQESEDGKPVPDTRSDPIGPTFSVTKDEPATLRFDVSACKANYQWSIEITYSIDGDLGRHTFVSGPYRTMAFADKTKMYTYGENNTYAEAGSADGPSGGGWTCVN